MKIVSIVGARPQFIKLAPITRLLRKKHTDILVHTGQHYDDGMSACFFLDLGIPQPDYNLEVGSGSHGRQTGEMLIKVEKVLESEAPDYVLVYGDTNSTLAGAIAAVKMHIPIAHIEAGLRSYNKDMPEEHNRVLTDHCSQLLFCPTPMAVRNLEHEGICSGVHLVGDVMYDAVLQFSSIAQERSRILAALQLRPKDYFLATLHRPSNTDNVARLQQFLHILLKIGATVVFPAHPRTQKLLSEQQCNMLQQSNVKLIPPLGYLDMLMLERNARMILSDSGGVQKEAFLCDVPCITLRTETEWVETVACGWNEVTGLDRTKIMHAIYNKVWPTVNESKNVFGNGHASDGIVRILEEDQREASPYTGSFYESCID